MNVWQVLEDMSEEDRASDVADLYSWSLNYDAGTGPFPLFLDLIGWSFDTYGEQLYRGMVDDGYRLGYVELSKLADALKAYSDDPRGTLDVVNRLMDAEMDEEVETDA